MSSHVRSAMMKAVRVHKFGGPEVLSLKSGVPIPKPSRDQVLIRVCSAGVNPVDTYIRSGVYASLPELPYTPGGDSAGIVHDVGEGVTKFKKGDRVFTVFSATGSLAEYLVTNAMTTFPLHSSVTYQQGAAMGVPYFTAYRALVTKAAATAGQTVLVHGASGGVGLAAVQIGRALGLRVLGTASTPGGLKAVRDNGAHETFNHKDADYLDKVKAFTDGQGVDIIVEMLADVNLAKDFSVINASGKGTIVIVGSRGSTDFMPLLIIGTEATVKGVALAKSTPEDFATANAFLQSGQELGWLRPVVGLEYTPEQTSEAHQEVMARKLGAAGKIVVNFSDGDTSQIHL